MPCHPACQTCTGGTANDCTKNIECAAGKYLYINGGGKSSYVYGLPARFAECRDCDGCCKTCKGPGYYNCIEKADTSGLSCADGTAPDLWGSCKSCKACHKCCETCNSPNKGDCIKAKVITCAAGEYKNDDCTCVKCDPCCKTCTGAGPYKCTAGDEIKTGDCAKYWPTTPATPAKAPLVCHHFCKEGKCTGPGVNECTECEHPDADPKNSCDCKPQFYIDYGTSSFSSAYTSSVLMMLIGLLAMVTMA